MRTQYLATLVLAGAALVASAPGASAGPYLPGDPPYTLNWDSYPQIQSGCWKWNWQQHQWNDFCPAYVQPKAFMHPRSTVVLRAKG